MAATAAPMTDSVAAPARAWNDAELIAALLAIDPTLLGGVVLDHPSHEAAREWLALLRACLPTGAPMRRLPASVTDDRLLGGVDLAATLTTGRLVVEPGVLAASDGGVVVLPMAERASASVLAGLVEVLDAHAVRVEREGIAARHQARVALVCYDESADDEALPQALVDRLAFRLIGLHVFSCGVRTRDALSAAVAEARQRHAQVDDGGDWLGAVCELASAYGITSLRAPLLAWRAARAHAALAGRDAVTEDDATVASRLVLLPRAVTMPAPPPEAQEDQPPPPPDQPPADEPPPPPPEAEQEERADEPPDTPPEEPETPPDSDDASDDARLPSDILRDAVTASLPPGMLEQLLARSAAMRGVQGRVGEETVSLLRGRPRGARQGEPRGGARLHLLETLRTAAPWQKVRGRMDRTQRVALRKDDFRVRRFIERSGTTVIFVVDASGSSALARLSEAKGAIELLLAESYARRDRVSLIAFRGTTADTLLPATRALARAKKVLAALPGGGGTPMATAIDAAALAGLAAQRAGSSPLVVFLTDGRANIARDGTPGRGKAGEDALASARAFAQSRLSALFVDTSLRPDAPTRALAAAMGARYVPLPSANSTALSGLVRTVQQQVAGA
jgi:magnesium chelatase subunit D